MATFSSQAGAKKERKAPRPLIAPALPLNLKSRSGPTSEPAVKPTPDVDVTNASEAAEVAEQANEAALNIQALKEAAATNSTPESFLNKNNAKEPVFPEPEAQPERRPSSAAPELTNEITTLIDEITEPSSRSVATKASFRAASSSIQSPAPESAQAGSQVNGVASEALEATPVSVGGSLETYPGHHAQALAPTQSNQTAQLNSTIMPRRCFSSEEPILDWADEMSEEMPPDTLHIPSVPHLPELSSDSRAVHHAISQADVHVLASAHPPKPVFGSTSISEVQPDIMAEESPKLEASVLTNGYSYTPERKLDHADTDLTPPKPDRSIVPLVNGHVHQSSQVFSDQPMSDILSHLSKLFDSREWADWTIQLLSLNASYPPIAYHAHGAVISRNQVLCSHMRSHLQVRAMTTMITLSPPRYVQPAAFEAALKYLYNEKVLTPTEASRYFIFDGTTAESTMKTYRLDFCFSYWLSGCLLGISPIMGAGLELLYEYLDWDTAELLVKAALDMKTLPSTQRLSKLSSGATAASSIPGAATSPRSVRATDAGTEQMGITQESHSIPIIGVLTDAVANGRLRLDLHEFVLYTSPPDILRSHLPDVQKHGRPNSALSSIMFGSLPTTSLSTNGPDRSLQPVFSFGAGNIEHEFSSAEKALSAILLNIPFKELSKLFNGFMGAFAVEDVLSLFAKVLSERESRRIIVADSDWYRLEVASKQRLPEVDLSEVLIKDGERSCLKRSGYDSSRWD